MPNKGYKQTAEHRKKNSDRKKKIYQNEGHPRWKGDNASYRALHKWVERKLGTPRQCEKCKVVIHKQHRMHWANISGNYIRNLTDWIRLCAKCHGEYDAAKRKQKCI